MFYINENWNKHYTHKNTTVKQPHREKYRWEKEERKRDSNKNSGLPKFAPL
jgi:hypothetical protein